MQREIFHALSLFQAALATAFVSECFFHLLSCSVIIVAAWPDHAQPPAVNEGHTQPPVVLLIWYTRLHAHVLPHPACFFVLCSEVSCHRDNQEQQDWLGSGQVCICPFLSLSSVIFISSSYSLLLISSFQCKFKNSCGVFLKVLFWIKQNYLFWKAVNVNYVLLALL